jgi:hypothetical protein
MEQHSEISNTLKQYAFFQEAILESINFSKNLLDVELTFNTVVDENLSVRKDLDKKKYVTLRFNTVQAFNINGGLNIHQILNPELTNWGLNEITCIRVMDNSQLLKDATLLNATFNHVQILWEKERQRQIDIVFETMLIYEGLKAS